MIDLPSLNSYVAFTEFKVMMMSLMFGLIRKEELMFSTDFKDACFQIPIRLNSWHFLWIAWKARSAKSKVSAFAFLQLLTSSPECLFWFQSGITEGFSSFDTWATSLSSLKQFLFCCNIASKSFSSATPLGLSSV